MKKRISHVRLIVQLGLLLATACFGQTYKVMDLLPGHSPSCAHGINECGQVIGVSSGYPYPSAHPFLSPDALPARIPPKEFFVVTPEDINQ